MNVHWNGLAEVVALGRMWLGTGVVVLWALPPLPLTLMRRDGRPGVGARNGHDLPQLTACWEVRDLMSVYQ